MATLKITQVDRYNAALCHCPYCGQLLTPVFGGAACHRTDCVSTTVYRNLRDKHWESLRKVKKFESQPPIDDACQGKYNREPDRTLF